MIVGVAVDDGLSFNQIGRMCNLAKYLIEQESACRDTAQVVDHRPALSSEWLAVADGVLSIRARHVSGCPICRQSGS